MMRLPTAKQKNELKKHLRFHLKGEPAFLRAVDPKKKFDLDRYKSTFTDPKINEYLTGIKSKTTKKQLSKLVAPNKNVVTFAVSNNADKRRDMKGWVQVAVDEKHRVEKLHKNNQDRLVLEVSYARCPLNSRKRVKGLITSGVKQACLWADKLEEQQSVKEGTAPRKIIINAYVDKGNKASRKVLERAGFVYQRKILYNNPKFKKYKDDAKLCYYRLSPKKLQEMLKSRG